MARKNLSQLDPGGVLKDSHDFDSHALRTVGVNSLVPDQYDRPVMAYDVDCNLTKATFYRNTKAENTMVEFNADVLSNLNNKYFELYSSRNKEKYYVWYNVASLGTDPMVPDATGIEVNINANDTAEVVAIATELYVKLAADRNFTVKRTSKCIEFINVEMGPSSGATDVNTGFSFTTKVKGAETVVKVIKFEYDANGNLINAY
jgi:hypothetical protein